MSHLLISQKQRDQICVMLDSLKPEFGAVGSRDVEVRMRRDDVDLIISTLAALTKPAIPALKLPDGWVAVPLEPTEEMIAAWRDDMDKSYAKEHAIKIGEDEIVFAHQAMLAAAPAVPRTAPIEPICATGGAEWVKCSERMPDDDTLCLGIDADGVIWTMHYDCGELVTDTYGVELPDITHWMPLPAAPVA